MTRGHILNVIKSNNHVLQSNKLKPLKLIVWSYKAKYKVVTFDHNINL